MSAYRKVLRALPALALALGLALHCGGAGSNTALAAAPGYSEDEIEAAFVYRFASFVSWPDDALRPSEFTVAVLDDDAVASDLERMLARSRLQDHPAQVRRITAIGQLGDARILFVGDSDASRLKRWLAMIAGRPVLVVTNQPGGLDDGSTINFLVTDRVRFEISLAAARRARLTISAELLSVATRVEGGPIGSALAPRLAAK